MDLLNLGGYIKNAVDNDVFQTVFLRGERSNSFHISCYNSHASSPLLVYVVLMVSSLQ